MHSRSWPRRALAALTALALAAAPLQPAAAAAREALGAQQANPVKLALAAPSEAFQRRLAQFPAWLDSVDAEAAAQSAVLALLANPALAEEQRGAMTAETAAAYDAAVKLLSADPALRERVERLRARGDAAALRSLESGDSAPDKTFDNADQTERVIVTGYEPVGQQVVSLLQRLRQPVAVVAPSLSDDDRRRLERRGVRAVTGLATPAVLLKEAGVNFAKALIATADDDAGNIHVASEADEANPKIPIVARIFDRDKKARELEQELLRKTQSVSALSAPVFAASVLGQDVLASFELDGQTFTVGYAPGEAAGGKTVEAFSQAVGVAAIALRRDDKIIGEFGPKTIIAPSDEVLVVGPRSRWQALVGRDPAPSPWLKNLGRRIKSFYETLSHLTKFLSAWLTGVVVGATVFYHLALSLSVPDSLYYAVMTMSTVGGSDINLMHYAPWIKWIGGFFNLTGYTLMVFVITLAYDIIKNQERNQQRVLSDRVHYINHVVVAGVGTVGLRTIQELLKMGQQVVAIEKNADNKFIRRLPKGVPLIIGDAGDVETLEKAKVADARAVVAATNDDDKNIDVAFGARGINPDIRRVVRTLDPDLAEGVSKKLKINAVRSPSSIAAPSFVGAALYPRAVQSFILQDRLVVLLHRHGEADGDAGTPLLARPNLGAFQPVASGAALAKGDERIEAIMLPLSPAD